MLALGARGVAEADGAMLELTAFEAGELEGGVRLELPPVSSSPVQKKCQGIKIHETQAVTIVVIG